MMQLAAKMAANADKAFSSAHPECITAGGMRCPHCEGTHFAVRETDELFDIHRQLFVKSSATLYYSITKELTAAIEGSA